MAHAIASTSPVLASRIHSGLLYWRRSDETPALADDAVSLFFRYFSSVSGRYEVGWAAPKMAGEISPMWAAARSTVHPGFKRPIGVSHHAVMFASRPLPSPARTLSAQAGSATSKRRAVSTPVNPGGATARTGKVRPLR